MAGPTFRWYVHADEQTETNRFVPRMDRVGEMKKNKQGAGGEGRLLSWWPFHRRRSGLCKILARHGSVHDVSIGSLFEFRTIP
eukprot:scaffold360_cov374-Pavlova_lutheri.AAC.62